MFVYALLSALNDIISRSQRGLPLTRRDVAVLRLFDGLSGTAAAAAAGVYLQYGPHSPLLDLLMGSLGTGLAAAFLRWRNSPDGQIVLDGSDPSTDPSPAGDAARFPVEKGPSGAAAVNGDAVAPTAAPASGMPDPAATYPSPTTFTLNA